MKLLHSQFKFSPLPAFIRMALVCCLGICPMASAEPLPVNDNTAPPYVGVFSGILSEDGILRATWWGPWLGRSGVWVESFNGGNDTQYTWSDLEGKDSIMQAGKRWVQAYPGNKWIFSTGMLPGTVSGGVGSPQSGHTLAKGANGDYDAHWQALAARIVAQGPPDESIVIRLGWEFNGWWYPWCIQDGTTGMNATDFANYFKRIVTVMKAVPGCENLKFCWNGATNWTSYSVRSAYPADYDVNGVILAGGNNYVDYIGVDVYDTASAYPGTTQEIRDAAWKEQQGKPASGGTPSKNNIYWWKITAEHSNYGQGKPICFPEWGLSSNASNGGGDNPEFIRHMFEFIHESTNNVAWHCYFDTSSASNHRISSPPGAAASIHPTAQAKFKQLFGLPLPNKNDIGTVGIPGTCDGITVSGAGTGYLTTGTTDNFFFSSGTSSTNDMFVVEIKSMASGTAPQSGVMLRQGFAAGDKYAAVFLRNGQCVFQSRTAAGGAAVQNSVATVAAPTPTAPVWLKLVRLGNSITGYYSTDGALNWVYAGGQTVSLTGTAYVGLAVSSGNTTALNATSEDNIDNANILTGLETSITSKIIKDNADATGIVKSAGWATGTTRTGKYGADYNSAGTDLPAKTITFTPTLASTGLYDVYMRWPDRNTSATDLASDVPVSITSTSGVESLTVDQQVGKSLWNYVGTYSLSPAAGSLQISSSTTGSGAYTMADAVMFVPLPVPAGAVNYEAETVAGITSSSGDVVSVFTEAAASGGAGSKLASNAATDFIQYPLLNVPAGTYTIKVMYKRNTTRGIFQLSIDGVNVGAPVDEYGTGAYVEATVVTNKTLSAGTHNFRFTVTDKNSGSSGYDLTVDRITLEP